MAFGPSGLIFRVSPIHGMVTLPTALAAIPSDWKKNIHAYHANLLGQLAKAGRRRFTEDIKRPAESGEGIGGNRDRQTGKFTFGVRSGGAFVGRLMEENGQEAFGWPDVEHADAVTNYVWRSLEHGLKGTETSVYRISGAVSTGYFASDVGYMTTMPRGVHRLPRAFHFTSSSPASAKLRLGYDPSALDPSGNRRKSQDHIRRSLGRIPMKSKYGAGFEGKRFIAGSWGEVINNQRMIGKYDTIIRKSFEKAF